MVQDFSVLIKEVQDKGVAFREQALVGVPTEKLAHAIGEPVSLGAVSPVHALAPKTQDEAGHNTYSGYYGLAMFPLHTDMANWHTPPRYLMLRCLLGAKDVATLVLDPSKSIAEIGVENLARALMKPRRRVTGRMGLLPLVERRDEGLMIRWDERYLQPASRAGAFYTAELQEKLRTTEVTNFFLEKPGDTVVIDNWRMLHGRAAVSEASRSRRIERVYLKALT
jgi:L-asparagine oxygenase